MFSTHATRVGFRIRFETCRFRRTLRTATLVLTTASASSALASPNLIVNPGAEAGSPGTSVPGWSVTSSLIVVSYTSGGGFPVASDPGSPTRGKNFFSGGEGSPSSAASQIIDLSGSSAAIDAHAATFTLSGWLGGYTSQDDHCDVAVSFRNAASMPIGSGTIGGVLASHRGQLTGMLFRSASGSIPAGTRSALVTITMSRAAGSYNDGYADDISFSLDARCLGDLNNDGQVDDVDFTIFAPAYDILDCTDPGMPAGCPADLNGDGVVDDLDFSIFAVAYDALLCP